MLRCLPSLLPKRGDKLGWIWPNCYWESHQQSPKCVWKQEGWETWLQELASKYSTAAVGTGTNGVPWAGGHSACSMLTWPCCHVSLLSIPAELTAWHPPAHSPARPEQLCPRSPGAGRGMLAVTSA